MTRRPLTAALLALTAAAALSACGGEEGSESAGAKPEGRTVQTKTFIYSPDPITVKAGTTVTFENLDATVHTITAGTRAKPAPEQFDGKMEPTTGSFEHTFETPGTYPYFCSLHSGDGMTGEVVVE